MLVGSPTYGCKHSTFAAVLGLYIAPSQAAVHLLVAESTRPVTVPTTAITLHAVTKAAWLSVDCRTHGGPSTDLPPRWEVSDGHYYCDTHDVTTPFPFAPSTGGPAAAASPAYLANQNWTRPLQLAGLGAHASGLVHGEVRALAADPVAMALFTRRFTAAPAHRLQPSQLSLLLLL
jgi:hypothetical protein